MDDRNWTRTAVHEPGNGTRYMIIWGAVDGVPFIALPDFGRAAVAAHRPVEHTYLASKLSISEPDALAVFEFLRDN